MHRLGQYFLRREHPKVFANGSVPPGLVISFPGGTVGTPLLGTTGPKEPIKFWVQELRPLFVQQEVPHGPLPINLCSSSYCCTLVGQHRDVSLAAETKDEEDSTEACEPVAENLNPHPRSQRRGCGCG
jgi:hypothetical protein